MKPVLLASLFKKASHLRSFSLLMLITVAAGLSACKEQHKEETALLPGMKAVDLSAQGLSAVIQVPDSTHGKLDISNHNDGTTRIRIGKNFHLSIYEGAEEGRMELERGDIMGNDVNKFKRFLVDEPNTILYESEIVEPEYHFFTIISTGKKTYVIQDAKEEKFSERAARKMLESAKTIQQKEASPAGE